jgi:glutathione S-transferase
MKWTFWQGRQTPKFLTLNPNGKVPLMILADGRVLPESNAILSYLADGSALAGSDRYAKANILRWLLFRRLSLREGVVAPHSRSTSIRSDEVLIRPA